MNKPLKLRRFWDKATYIKDDDGFRIYLDKQLLRLPQKSILTVSNETLAKRIVDEWQNAGCKKGDIFSFDTLPITRIISTLIEKIKPDRKKYIDVLLPYVNGELLCYRAEKPKQLVNRQNQLWQPILQWIEEFLHITFRVTKGVMPIMQDKQTINKIKTYIMRLSDEELTFFAVIIPLLGSVVLSIAIFERKLSAQQGFEYAYLDEHIQSQIWGYDAEQQQRLNLIQKEINECVDYLEYVNN